MGGFLVVVKSYYLQGRSPGDFEIFSGAPLGRGRNRGVHQSQWDPSILGRLLGVIDLS